MQVQICIKQSTPKELTKDGEESCWMSARNVLQGREKRAREKLPLLEHPGVMHCARYMASFYVFSSWKYDQGECGMSIFNGGNGYGQSINQE